MRDAKNLYVSTLFVVLWSTECYTTPLGQDTHFEITLLRCRIFFCRTLNLPFYIIFSLREPAYDKVYSKMCSQQGLGTVCDVAHFYQSIADHLD